jgi:hypothetical protein
MKEELESDRKSIPRDLVNQESAQVKKEYDGRSVESKLEFQSLRPANYTNHESSYTKKDPQKRGLQSSEDSLAQKSPKTSSKGPKDLVNNYKTPISFSTHSPSIVNFVLLGNPTKPTTIQTHLFRDFLPQHDDFYYHNQPCDRPAFAFHCRSHFNIATTIVAPQTPFSIIMQNGEDVQATKLEASLSAVASGGGPSVRLATKEASAEANASLKEENVHYAEPRQISLSTRTHDSALDSSLLDFPCMNSLQPQHHTAS